MQQAASSGQHCVQQTNVFLLKNLRRWMAALLGSAAHLSRSIVGFQRPLDLFHSQGGTDHANGTPRCGHPVERRPDTWLARRGIFRGGAHSYRNLVGFWISHTFFTCRVSMHGRFHVWPLLIEFCGVVLSCFARSRSSILTEVSAIKSIDSLMSPFKALFDG